MECPVCGVELTGTDKPISNTKNMSTGVISPTYNYFCSGCNVKYALLLESDSEKTKKFWYDKNGYPLFESSGKQYRVYTFEMTRSYRATSKGQALKFLAHDKRNNCLPIELVEVD